MIPAIASWEDLNSFVQERKYLYDDRWKIIEQHPLTVGSIDQLCRRGLEVKTANLSPGFLGTYNCSPPKRIGHILLNSNLSQYKRDVTLFHELGHVWFDVVANFSFPDIIGRTAGAETNGAIIEWLARQWRATPHLLQHAIHSFRLQEQIYDAASYNAFAPLEQESRQLAFEFYYPHP